MQTDPWLQEWQDRWSNLSLYWHSYTCHTMQFLSKVMSVGTVEKWAALRYFSLQRRRRKGTGREMRHGPTFVCRQMATCLLKKSLDKKGTQKVVHTTTSAFFPVAALFHSRKALWEHSWVDPVENSTVRQQYKKKALTATKWQKCPYCERGSKRENRRKLTLLFMLGTLQTLRSIFLMCKDKISLKSTFNCGVSEVFLTFYNLNLKWEHAIIPN